MPVRIEDAVMVCEEHLFMTCVQCFGHGDVPGPRGPLFA